MLQSRTAVSVHQDAEGTHGHRLVGYRIFACPILLRQGHVVNRKGGPRYRHFPPSQTVVIRSQSIFRRLHRSLGHGIQVRMFQFAIEGKDNGNECSDRGPLIGSCAGFGMKTP